LRLIIDYNCASLWFDCKSLLRHEKILFRLRPSIIRFTLSRHPVTPVAISQCTIVIITVSRMFPGFWRPIKSNILFLFILSWRLPLRTIEINSPIWHYNKLTLMVITSCTDNVYIVTNNFVTIVSTSWSIFRVVQGWVCRLYISISIYLGFRTKAHRSCRNYFHTVCEIMVLLFSKYV
jgi:hypothetical protein